MLLPKFSLGDVIVFDNNGLEQGKIVDALVDTDKDEWNYTLKDGSQLYESEIIGEICNLQSEEGVKDIEGDKSFDAWFEQSDLMKDVKKDKLQKEVEAFYENNPKVKEMKERIKELSDSDVEFIEKIKGEIEGLNKGDCLDSEEFQSKLYGLYNSLSKSFSTEDIDNSIGVIKDYIRNNFH